MNATTYIQKVNSNLKLPAEAKKDVLKELNSHLDNLSNNTQMENVMGDPEKLAKKVNKSRRVGFPEILGLPSTWLEIFKVGLFASVVQFVLFLLLVLLSSAVTTILNDRQFYRDIEGIFVNNFPTMKSTTYVLINNLLQNLPKLIVILAFLIGQLATVIFVTKQNTFRTYKLQSLVAMYLSIIPTGTLLYILFTQDNMSQPWYLILFCFGFSFVVVSILFDIHNLNIAKREESKVIHD